MSGICRRDAGKIDCFRQSKVKLKMENINSWKDIQWATAESKIFRLQLRIYKALANQEFEKVRKLQKLLIDSQLAKYLAVRRVTQDNSGKKTPGIDKRIYITPEEKYKLANRLSIDGKSSPILRTYILKSDGSQRPLGIPTIEDRAKQMLVYLAINPQWEAHFEAKSYGFRPGRSVNDAIEAIFLGISKKSKWVLDADISKCFDKINHEYLLQKCNISPEIKRQIKAWLKAGILDGEEYAFPEMGTPQGGIISPLLANIALHGIQDQLDNYINSLGGNRRANRQTTTFVRYADDFIVMHPDKETLEGCKETIQEFLKPIGLELNVTKTQMVHTLIKTKDNSPGFTFLGFDIVQRRKWVRMRAAFTKRKSNQKFITLIKPSQEGLKRHKSKLKEVIRRYRGASQERLIQKLNPIIRGYALSKRSQIASRTFQNLDQYVFIHLWKWAKRRHPKMSLYKLKSKYWQQIGNRNWVFGVKQGEEVSLQLQYHSKIPIKRHAMVKGNASPFDGNSIYWSRRTGKSLLIPPIKAKLIKEQNGLCGICGRPFLPDDTIERDHIIPKALGGPNRRENVHVVHNYCHRQKTNAEMLQIRRKRRLAN